MNTSIFHARRAEQYRVALTYAAVIGIVLCVDALVWVVLAVAK